MQCRITGSIKLPVPDVKAAQDSVIRAPGVHRATQQFENQRVAR